MRYAWFTVGLPESTQEEAVLLLKKYNYDGIEWRIVSDKGDTSKPTFWKGNRTTLQDDWSDKQYRTIADFTRNNGLEMPNLGSYAKAYEFDKVKRMVEIAAIMGIPTLRVNLTGYDGKNNYNDLFRNDTENFNKIIQFTKTVGVKPLIEIHMNTIIPSASAAIRFVSQWASDDIGVIHDVGNMVYEGFENYKMGLEMLGSYLCHVHVKSAYKYYETTNGPQSLIWKTAASPLRTGGVNFIDFISALKAINYDAWLSFEDFSIAAPQEEKVKDAITFLKEIEHTVNGEK